VLVSFLLSGVNTVPFKHTCSSQHNRKTAQNECLHVERLRAGGLLAEGSEQCALLTHLRQLMQQGGSTTMSPCTLSSCVLVSLLLSGAHSVPFMHTCIN
jgi:hypothetical protein